MPFLAKVLSINRFCEGDKTFLATNRDKDGTKKVKYDRPGNFSPEYDCC